MLIIVGFHPGEPAEKQKFDTVVLLLGDGSTSGYPAPKKNY